MTSREITRQLGEIDPADCFEERLAELADTWLSSGVGTECVRPVLAFMEDHPDLDFGSPGPLVHFVERFYGPEYVDELTKSVQRAPTSVTVWMLNRVINGTSASEDRQRLIGALSQVKSNSLAHPDARDLAGEFLVRLSGLP